MRYELKTAFRKLRRDKRVTKSLAVYESIVYDQKDLQKAIELRW